MTTIAQPLNNDKPLSRREFLYYLGGASLALLSAGTCGGITWFLTPDPHAGEFAVDIEPFARNLRYRVSPVFAVPDAHVYLALLDTGMVAVYRVCPFDEILVKWVWTNHRYECPACGSKYRLNGTYIEGPSERGLDHFGLRVRYTDGTTITSNDGTPIPFHDAADIVITTQQYIFGAPRGVQ